MRIGVELAFDEKAAVRLLNWLAGEDALIMRAYTDYPLLYDSGVRYRREAEETWSDTINLYIQGHEDCDALAAARAGELQARGYRALSIARGDSGAVEAHRRRIQRIRARVVLRTKTDPGVPGLYHCIVRYEIGRHVYYDDPSLRLGMRGWVNLRQPFIEPIPHPRRRTR